MTGGSHLFIGNWAVWANLVTAVAFIALCVVTNKFMLARNTVLRNRHHWVIASAHTPLLQETSGTCTRSSRRDSGLLGGNFGDDQADAKEKRGRPPTIASSRRGGGGRKSRRSSGHSFISGPGLSGLESADQAHGGRANASSSANPSANPIRSQHLGVEGGPGAPATSEDGEEEAGVIGERELEEHAQQVLLDQNEVEIDISRVFKDGTTLFYFWILMYGLTVSIITTVIVLNTTQRYSRKMSNHVDILVTAFPVMFFYAVIACLCEKLFSLSDLVGSRSRRQKTIRRSLLLVVSELPSLVAIVLDLALSTDKTVTRNLSYGDILTATCLSGALAFGGYTSSTITQGEQRNLCAKVSFISTLFVLGRAALQIPYVQTNYLNKWDLLTTTFIFNVAISVPVSAALFLLKRGKPHPVV